MGTADQAVPLFTSNRRPASVAGPQSSADDALKGCGANAPPALRVIGGKGEQRAASVAEIAAVEFAAIKEFRGRTKVERLKRVHDITDSVRVLAAIAAEIVVMNKAELIARVKEKHEELGPCLMELAHGF
jgi:hypothetical protein